NQQNPEKFARTLTYYDYLSQARLEQLRSFNEPSSAASAAATPRPPTRISTSDSFTVRPPRTPVTLRPTEAPPVAPPELRGLIIAYGLAAFVRHAISSVRPRIPGAVRPHT
ncbi:hypothetical protein, partial [Streptomyces sp. NPDC007346]|uniref:hypothetical protein n=1 Tax=Streptomyces sp. NPDC007346 TaxID=3154682 RepID=UPI0034511B2E